MSDFYIEGLFLHKVSDVSGVPVEYIMKLRDMQLLDETKVRHMLIRNDYHALSVTGKFTEQQLYERIAGIYSLTPEYVRNVINRRIKPIYCCKHCGCKISPRQYKENAGMCNRCAARAVTL